MVDIGQYVSPGKELGSAYAIDTIEVRLPLTNQQLAFVDLPEEFVDGAATIEGPEVLLSSEVGGKNSQWTARITRVEGVLPPKMGLFTDAIVKGRELNDVFVLPRKVLRPDGDVVVIQDDHTILRVQVEPLWSDRENVVLSANDGALKAGQVVCLTPLAFPANGSRVIPTIDGIAPSTEFSDGSPMGKRKAVKGGS